MSLNSQSTCLVPSRFNMWTKCKDGTLLVFNSFSGAFIKFNSTETEYLTSILADASFMELECNNSLLTKQGLLIPSSINEMELARSLYELPNNIENRLHLILMPTESCNFRCTYCYEKIKLNRMSSEVVDSIIQLVRQKLKLQFLSIMWFGGEPLIAFDIIQKISHEILLICKERQIEYSAGITTNGYLLTDQLIEQCFSAKISKFQITLDGPVETHDKLRILAGGGETFNTIITNLRKLHDKDEHFHVRIRVNFIPDMIPHLPKFIKFIKREFDGDPRFTFSFRPVADLGRLQDNSIRMCDYESAMNHEIQMMKLASKEGFSLDSWKESMQLFGSVCYAADPCSFVILPDGKISKCTVAFDDIRNQIGRILPNGKMNILEKSHRFWKLSWDELEPECQQCSFFPACQGNMCPLERINQYDKTCPIVKTHLDECLPLLATEAIISLEDREKLNE